MNLEKVLNVIKYVKTNRTRYRGKGHEIGYHSFVLDGKRFDGSRDNEVRISKIEEKIKLDNKNVLDIGCNMGGMLHAIDNKIKSGVGIDFSYKSINAANIVKAYKNINNLQFYVFNLDLEDLNVIDDLVDEIDVVFFLAVAMHIKNWQKVIEYCHKISNVLIFESNGNFKLQDRQIEHIKNVYENVEYVCNFGNRKMFICQKEK